MLCHPAAKLRHDSYNLSFLRTAEHADNGLQAGIQSHKLMSQIKSKIKTMSI